MKHSALFLDRDGIIILPIDKEAPQKPEQLQIIPTIIPVINAAQESGYLTIIVSNQPDIALGKIDHKTLTELENRFQYLLKINHISIDGEFYCYHHEKGVIDEYSQVCDCRKPKPGLLLKAAKDFNIDLTSSFMLGDRASDIKAGHQAGTKTILFDPLNTQSQHLKKHAVKPDYYTKNLQEVINIICRP